MVEIKNDLDVITMAKSVDTNMSLNVYVKVTNLDGPSCGAALENVVNVGVYVTM